MNKPEPKFVRDLEVNSFMSENDVPIIVKDTPNGPLTFFVLAQPLNSEHEH